MMFAKLKKKKGKECGQRRKGKGANKANKINKKKRRKSE
jgi:hypothetical protein